MSDEGLDTVELTLAKLKEVFGSDFTYYDGDPLAIPAFNLPAIIVEQTGDDTAEESMGVDEIRDELVVKVVLDKRDDFKSGVDTTNLTRRRIRKYVSRRDPQTKNYAENTVKHAIRSMLLENFTGVESNVRVDYGVNPRVTGDGLADLTEEGHVTFSIEWESQTH